jgi:hypothetical protein
MMKRNRFLLARVAYGSTAISLLTLGLLCHLMYAVRPPLEDVLFSWQEWHAITFIVLTAPGLILLRLFLRYQKRARETDTAEADNLSPKDGAAGP